MNVPINKDENLPSINGPVAEQDIQNKNRSKKSTPNEKNETSQANKEKTHGKQKNNQKNETDRIKEDTLNVGFWNVEGLYEKMHLNDICDFIGALDIVGLGETFTLSGFDFSLKFPEHHALHCPATKYSKLGRPSGGLVILIRKIYSKFIELVDTQISHVLAFKIKKELFNTPKDLLIIMMYNHPRESVFYKYKDYYSTLEQVDHFLANSMEKGQEFHLLIGGDINARIGDWA